MRNKARSVDTEKKTKMMINNQVIVYIRRY